MATTPLTVSDDGATSLTTINTNFTSVEADIVTVQTNLDNKNHSGADITTGLLIHEVGGLELDVSAFSGLVKIDAGVTTAVTAPTGNLVGTTDTQTLTNKTIDPASNTIDGDVLDITYTPTNYTPDVTAPEATDVNDLSAHLKGIDNTLTGNAVDYQLISRTFAAASATTTYSHTIGSIPSKAELSYVYSNSSGVDINGNGYYDGTNQGSINLDIGGSAGGTQSTTQIVHCLYNGNTGQTGIIQNLTTTDFDINWTLLGSPTANAIQILIKLYS